MIKSPGNEAKMNWNWDHSGLAGVKWGSALFQVLATLSYKSKNCDIQSNWRTVFWLVHMVDTLETGSCNLEKYSRMAWE